VRELRTFLWLQVNSTTLIACIGRPIGSQTITGEASRDSARNIFWLQFNSTTLIACIGRPIVSQTITRKASRDSARNNFWLQLNSTTLIALKHVFFYKLML
jgi:hypothetical protein